MAGIQSLMQGPVPGQAPQQPMPGMMPQQGAPTPQGITGQLERMEPARLLSMYNNPQDMTPKWAVASAYARAVEQQRMLKMAQGQGAMAQNSQMQQQPPVAQQVMSQPVMAAHGGIMHGYAGGGAVAFDEGGDIRVKRILQKSPFERTAEENEILRAAGVELTRRTIPEGGISALNKMLEGPFFRRAFTGEAYKLSPEELAKRTDAGATTERLFRTLGGQQFAESPASPAETKSASTQTEAPSARPDIPRFTSQELERFVKTPSPSPAPGAPEPQKRQTAAAPKPGVSGLVGPEIDPYTLEARQAAGEYQTALQKATQLTPEQIAARRKIDEAMTGRKTFINTEEQRRELLAEKRLREALERSRVKPLEDITFIGQMLEGMKGAKRFGEGLAGLASGAGKAQAGREAALRAAEEKYDLSRNDIFKLQDARNQLDMDEAKLAEARATGHADKINAAAANVARSKMDLAKLQSDMQDRALGRRLEREKIDVEREKVLAALEGTRAGREASAEQRLMGQLGRLDQFKLEEIRKLEADHVKDPKYRMVYALASTGAQLTPDQEAQYRAANADLAAKRKRVSDAIDQRVSQIESRLGYSSMTGTDLQQWGEPTIKKGG